MLANSHRPPLGTRIFRVPSSFNAGDRKVVSLRLTRCPARNSSHNGMSLQMSFPLITRVAAIFAKHKVSLEALVRNIRGETAGMPLTILVHGCGRAASVGFLAEIEPLLETNDAVWLPVLPFLRN